MVISLIVPAAGRGTRMGGEIPKALVRTGEVFLIEYTTEALVPHLEEIICVVSPSALETFEELLPILHGKKVKYVLQENPLGTAQAIERGLAYATGEISLVVWADHVGAHFFNEEVLTSCMNESNWDVIIPMVERANPYVYFEIDSNRCITDFHETRTGAPEVEIGLSDCGVFIVRNREISTALINLGTKSDTEVNFLKLIPEMNKIGIRTRSILLDDYRLTLGANSEKELQAVLLRLEATEQT